MPILCEIYLASFHYLLEQPLSHSYVIKVHIYVGGVIVIFSILPFASMTDWACWFGIIEV